MPGRWLALAVLVAAGVLAAGGRGNPPGPSPMAQAPPETVAPHVAGEVLIGFRETATAEQRAAVRSGLGARRTRRLGGAVERVELAPGLSVDQAVARYGRDPTIRFIEPNYLVHADELPDDPRFAEQYGLHNVGQTGGRPGADIDVEPAWRTTTGSYDVLVAVIDTGIDATHPDLAAGMWTHPGEIPDNGIDDDGNGFVDDVRGWDFRNDDNDPDDDNGHGTHVAGIIGATGDNGIGVCGVCWKVHLVALKFLDDNGVGSTADAIAAIDYARSIGARITNNSWGGAPFSQALAEAIRRANDSGVLFVVSAGNQGSDTDLAAYYPAGYDSPNVVSVAMTDHDGLLHPASNFGATTVDLGAPGAAVLSTIPGGRYGQLTGTSMAAPHVAGAAALLLSIAPALEPSELRALLVEHVEPDPSLAGVTVSGGRLNVRRMIEARDRLPPGAIDDLAVEHVTSDAIRLSWTATGDDGREGIARLYDLRLASAPIDAASFATAQRVASVPAPHESGLRESFEVAGLEPQQTYWLALVAVDEWGNAGPVGNTVAATTALPPSLRSSPPGFDVALNAGETTTRTLTLENVGNGPLDWRIVGQAAPPVPGAQGYGELAGRWLEVDRPAGRLLAGETASIGVTIDARDLDSDVYDGSVDVETNDPARPLAVHPVRLLVEGAPSIEVDPPLLDLGQVFVGATGTATLEIRNPGTETLHVGAIRVDSTATGEAVHVDPPALDVPPRGAGKVRISFSPTTPGSLDTAVLVESDAPSTRRVAVPLTARAAPAPRIAVDPLELHEVSDGATVRRTLAITNDGPSALTVALSFDDPAKAVPPPVLVNGGFETGDFSGWTASTTGSEQTGSWSVAEVGAGWFGNSDPFEGRFDALSPFDGPAGLELDLTQTFTIPPDAVRADLSFQERIQLDSLGNPSSKPRLYRATIEDLQGSVLLEVAREDVWLNLRPYTDLGWRRRFADLRAFAGETLRLHVHQRIPEASTGPAAFELDDFRVDLAAFPDWLRVDPVRATIPAGETVALDVSLDPAHAEQDVLVGAIRIETNVPDRPTVWVPVTFAVGAQPDIAVSGPPVRVESARRFATWGAATSHALPVTAPPAGAGTLEVVADGDFGQPDEFASVLVEGHALGTLGRIVDDCAPASGVFSLSAAQLARAVEDGVVHVDVRNSPEVTPFCLSDEHRVTLSYRTDAARPIDLGAVPVGVRATTTIAIANRGSLPLSVHALTTDDPRFACSPASLTVPPLGEQTVELSFEPDDASSFTGRLLVDSDDPDTPRIELSLTGSGGSPPVLAVTPPAIDASLATGERTTRELVLENRGGLPLELALSVETAEERAQARFEPLAPSPTPLSCIAGDPARGHLYAQENEGRAFFRYEAAHDSWVALAPSPIHAGDSCGAALVGGKVYTSYTEDARLGVYDAASDSWSTLPAAVGHTGTVGALVESSLVQLRDVAAARLDVASLEVRPIATPPFPFDRRGGLAALDGTLYGHQGHGGVGNVGFAAYDAATDAWTVLPIVPGFAGLGGAIDPLGRSYVSHGGPRVFVYSIDRGEWETLDNPLFSAADGGLTWLTDPPGLYLVQGESGRGLARLVAPPQPVRVDPPRVTIAPGDRAVARVSIDALGLDPGAHRADVVVATNEPGATRRVVPVRVQVEGVPDIAIGGEPRAVESASDFATSGATTRHVLRLEPGAEGPALLGLEVEGDFGSAGETATAFAGGRAFGPIGHAGTDCAGVGSLFHIERIEDLAVDGALVVEVSNGPQVDSFCGSNRHRVSLTYGAGSARLDFGRVLRGAERQLSLVLSNRGTATLHVGAISTDSPYFAADTSALDVAVGASARVRVAFSPDADATFAGTLTVSSDDPDTPAATVALTGEGIASPRLEVAPREIAVSLPAGESADRTLSVANAGEGPLELQVDIAAAAPGWLEVGPGTATLSPGSTIELVARIDSVGLVPGRHGAEIRIASNDPAAPLVSVPVTVDVVGSPRLALHGQPVTIESALPFIHAEQRTQHSLGVTVPPVAGGAIELIAEGDYYDKTATAVGEGRRLGSVYGVEPRCDAVSATFPLSPSELRDWSADGRVEIEVQNIAAVDPRICGTNRHTVRLRYDAALDRLDFGTRFAGAGGDRTVQIENTGTATLVIASVSTDVEAFVAQPSSMTLAPGTSAPLVVSYRPVAASESAGRLRIASNDPAAASVEVPLHGVAVAPPVLSVEPASFDLTLDRGERDVRPLQVANVGSGRLDLTFGIVPPTVGFVTIDRAAASLAPGETSRVDLSFDAQVGLGVHHADVEVVSNDPSRPVLTLPVTLTVTGAPSIRLSGQAATVESFADFSGSGDTTLHRLAVGQPPGGSGVVELTTTGDFGAEDETATVLAEGVALGSTAGPPVDCGTDRADFPVDAATLAGLAADGVVEIEVRNSRSVGAFCGTNRHGVLLRYHEALSLLDFGDVVVGASRRADIVVENAGTDTLRVASIASGNPAVLASPSTLVLQPGASREVAVYFSPADATALDTTLVVTSDDPDAPRITVPVQGRGARPPELVLAGAPIDAAVEAGQVVVRTLDLTNVGGLPLGFALTVLPASASFIAVEPVSGSVPAGGSTEIAVRIDAASLVAGTYAASIRVTSNDPARPWIDVPVTLDCSGTPRLALDGAAALDFGTVFVGGSAALSLRIQNPGTGPLDISSIVADTAAFVPSSGALSIGPGGSASVEVVFAPSAPGAVAGTLRLTSNDPGAGTVDVALSGRGAGPPVAEILPAELEAVVPAGSRVETRLTLGNHGPSPLDYSIAATSVDAGGAFPPDRLEAHFDRLAPPPAPVTCLVADAARGYVYAQERPGRRLFRFSAATGAWSELSPAPLDSGTGGGAALLGGRIYTSYALQSRIGVYDPATDSWSTISSPLGNTSNIASDGDRYLYLVRATFGRRLDPDTGDVAALPAPPFPFGQWAGLTWADGRLYGHAGTSSPDFGTYDPAANRWTRLAAAPGPGVLGAAFDSHAGRYVALGSTSSHALYEHALDGASWSERTLPLLPDARSGLAWLPRPVSAVYFAEDGGTGFARLVGRPSLAIVDRRAASVPPGGSVDVPVELDAGGLAAGTWRAGIVVSTSDPGRRVSVVPVTLSVEDGPRLALLGEVATRDSVAGFSDSGATTRHVLAVSAAPAGAGSLRVTVTGDFGAPGKRATVLVEGSPVGLVGGEAQGCASTSTTIPIGAADLAAFARDGVVEIEVRNAGSVAATCETNAHAVSLSYRERVERLEFGPVVLGAERARTITLTDEGTLPLTIDSLTSAPPFRVDASSTGLDPGESAAVTVVLTPSETGDLAGTLTIASNDPSAPRLDLPLVGSAVPPPELDLDPPSVEATLPEGGRGSSSLSVTNRGAGPLELRLAVVPPGPGFLSPAETAWTVPSGDSAGVELLLDARELAPGQHLASLRVESNDPIRPTVDVPVSLRVTGAPNLAVGGDAVVVESSRSFAGTGSITEHALPLAQTPVGAARLELVVEGDFGRADETASVVVEGRELGALGSLGPDCVPGTLELGIDSRQLREIAADGVVEVTVRNSDRVEPLCSTNRHQVRLSHYLPLDVVDFGEVVLGDRATRRLTLLNTGSVPLEVHSVDSDAPELVPSIDSGVVDPGQALPLVVSFEPSAVRPFEASLAIATDDPDTPVATVRLSGAGAEPPRIEVVPRELGVTLSDGDRATPGIVIRNTGSHPLEFSLAALPAPPFLALSTNAGIVPPGQSTVVTARLDADALGPGEIDLLLVVESNDPVEPLVEIPLRVNRLGDPDIAVVGQRVEIRSSMDFSGDGALTRHALAVSVPPAGAARLDIVAEGDFGSTPPPQIETASVRAEGRLLGEVGNEKIDCIPATGSFFLDSSDTERLVADGVVRVDVQNSDAVGFFCQTNRHTLVLSYDAPLERLDFGQVFAGSARARTLSVRNDGHGDLHVASVSADDPRIEVPQAAFVVAQGGSVELPVIFAPAGPGPLGATLTLVSDDLDEPRVTIDLVGQGLGAPAAEIDPDEIHVKLPPGRPWPVRRTLRLRNRGEGDLLWSAEAALVSPGKSAAVGQWIARSKGDDSDSGAGSLSIDRLGGPDAGGYRIRDSDEPEGPVFAWQDVSSVQTLVPLSGDDEVSGPVPIGFDFPFYGQRFDTVHVSADGWLSFTSAEPGYSNPDTLPNSGASVPANLIAPFWDDLHPREQTRIHAGGDSSRFVVQYDHIDRFAGGADLSFQAILYPSGTIVFQYRSMNGRTDSATIGIQNGERDAGLLVVYNESYVHDGLVVELAPVPPWMTLAPAAGIVPPGKMAWITIEMSGSGLETALHSAEIVVRTNDPARPETRVPVTFDADRSRSGRAADAAAPTLDP